METIELVYIGDEFYTKSKSIMSSLYTLDFARYDYGFLQRDLELGYNVIIRQATKDELKFSYNYLDNF